MKRIVGLLFVVLLLMIGCTQDVEVPDAPDETPENPVLIEGSIEDIARDFVGDIIEKDTDALLEGYDYEDEMKSAFTKTLIESVYADIEERFGALVRKGEVSFSEKSGFDIVSLLTEYEKGYASHNVVFNEKKEIAGYNYVIAEGPEGPGDLNLLDIAEGFAIDLYEKDVTSVLELYSYDDALKTAFTEAVINDILIDLESKFGQMVTIIKTEKSMQAGYDVVSVITEFEDETVSLNVLFDGDERIAGLNYFETTKPSDEEASILTIEVTFGKEPWLLNGNLTQPVRDVLIPAVVLVHGSGPNDRDESIYGNKPFKDIAEGLYQEGIAVLRYDKRSLTYGQEIVTSHMDDFTIYDETIDDARYAVEFLKSTPGIDPDRIFVLGHSLGANQGPRIAEGLDIGGLLLVAGNVTPLQDLMLKQFTYIYRIDGSMDSDEVAGLEQIALAVERINSDEIGMYQSEELLGLNPVYWADIKDYNPLEVAATLDIPIALFQGERDYQVPVEEFELWREALPTADAYSYPTLNHLMISGEGISTPEEYLTAGKVDESFIEDVGDWIKSK